MCVVNWVRHDSILDISWHPFLMSSVIMWGHNVVVRLIDWFDRLIGLSLGRESHPWGLVYLHNDMNTVKNHNKPTLLISAHPHTHIAIDKRQYCHRWFSQQNYHVSVNFDVHRHKTFRSKIGDIQKEGITHLKQIHIYMAIAIPYILDNEEPYTFIHNWT